MMTLSLKIKVKMFLNIQIYNSASITSTKNKTSHKKVKDFLENRGNKKPERNVSKEKKGGTSEEQKSQEELQIQ